ncbi:MAG: WbuC family cupin fold metalloprotein, partial [Anaerolineae bacterium]|nr:WbuC family cupin fold metalloprotein [Anaerolineae bacterium]
MTHTLRTITTFDIDNLIRMAKKSSRKRTILRLHEHEEPVQRMINAMIPGTYITPHKHENPDKVELFSILEGKCTVLHFDNRGEVADLITLSATGPNMVV